MFLSARVAVSVSGTRDVLMWHFSKFEIRPAHWGASASASTTAGNAAARPLATGAISSAKHGSKN
eukprot:4014962-Pyramimonas_sp.AAC.1